MNTSTLFRTTCLAIATTMALATAIPALADDQQAGHESHHPKDESAAAPATAASADASSTMMSNMKAMQDQMAKIRATTEFKARNKLLNEHLKTMQDTMKLMMSNGGGCPMMSGGQGADSGGMMGKGNMMQMMMDQMMQHQTMMQGPGK